MTATANQPLDLDPIRQRADAATEGPWEAGEVWATARVMDRFGADQCALCASCGSPVWVGDDLSGRRTHRHRRQEPWEPDHLISAANGENVAGNYDYEQGGIVNPADVEFIVHAREDVPALPAEVEWLRPVVDAAVAWRRRAPAPTRESAALIDAVDKLTGEQV